MGESLGDIRKFVTATKPTLPTFGLCEADDSFEAFQDLDMVTGIGTFGP